VATSGSTSARRAVPSRPRTLYSGNKHISVTSIQAICSYTNSILTFRSDTSRVTMLDVAGLPQFFLYTLDDLMRLVSLHRTVL